MIRHLVSHFLKGLLILLGIIALAIAFFFLPIVSNDLAESMPSIAYAKDVLLPVSQILLVLFVSGLFGIIYLLFLFDNKKVYSRIFIRILNALAILCFLGASGVVFVYFYISNLGGPGPGDFLLLSVSFLLILIVMMTILLIKYVVSDALKYKEELEYVV